jgi:8-oxo-dGTP pyrophosphatase MutT (NUDIX family)
LTGPRSLPPDLAERARAFAAGGVTPVDPRPAATVVLLRDGPAGPEAYLLRRRASMAFAAGMHAFPGGSVDPRDVSDEQVGWLGPDVAAWARRLGTDAPTARGFVCAAVRETFEEAGVLLAAPTDAAGRDGSPGSARPSGPDWDADRQALVDRRLALSELLDRRGLALRTDLLAPWAHWVTPRFEPRRYDTWFFVAALPADQEAVDVSGEADQVVWLPPGEAVAAAERGEIVLLPPTWAVLDELARYGSAHAVLDAAPRRTIRRIMPGWVDDGEAVRVVLPGEAGFPGDDRDRTE